jgi:hypothetical protein
VPGGGTPPKAGNAGTGGGSGKGAGKGDDPAPGRNPDGTPEKLSPPKRGEKALDWVKRNKVKLGSAAVALATVALTITGLALLPAAMLKKLGNAMFPFLPEEWRGAAVAGTSLCCCCCSCCLALALVVLSVTS